MSTARLQVTNLDFDAIKASLKTYLKQQSEFQDYDFEGSGLSVLIDLLAYNTHYNAYYLNMVANESFLDTAILRDSVVSHAKTLGYTPHSSRASVATINLTVETGTSTPSRLILPQGFNFLSNQIDSQSYNFVVLDDGTNDLNITKTGTKFLFENIQIYEGQLVTYNFSYDQSTNPKQVFTIPDENIDITTLSVTVTPSTANSVSSVYSKVTDVLDVTSSAEVFFLQESKNQKYQIYFGNDVVGKSLADGSLVSATYLVTNGQLANKANNFVATGGLADSLGNSLSNFVITPVSAAAGGAERESVDDIKFSATAQFSSQNRLVSYKDYESYILNNYPTLESVSVWGGENNIPKTYGKVYVSLKPYDGFYVSESEKIRIIEEIIKPKAVVTVQTEILDPDYLYLIVESKVQYDSKKLVGGVAALQNSIRNSVISYKDTNLNKFGAKFILSKLQDNIDDTDMNVIVGSETIVRLEKRFKPILGSSKNYSIYYNVPLHRGTITNKLLTSEFSVFDTQGVLRNVVFDEVPQSFSGIANISIVNPGTGYTTAPTVTITGDGIGATAEAVIVNGSVQSINVINRGIDYTRAIITITGGDGYGAAATGTIDARTGVIRTAYYDTNTQRQIVNETAGLIDYDAGVITINDINIQAVSTTDGFIRMSIESEKGIIESIRNTIITIDETDPTSIVNTLEAN
jgi:hypothetical protein